MRYGAIIGIALSALALFGTFGVANAQSDCKTLVKPSPFGPDDQIGATNRITPAVTKAAAAEIQTGAVVPMAYNLVDGVPLALRSQFLLLSVLVFFPTRLSPLLTPLPRLPSAPLALTDTSNAETTR